MPVLGEADRLQGHEGGGEPGLHRAILEIGHRAPILRRVREAGEGEGTGQAHSGEAGDQALVERVELVGARRQAPGRESVLQPEPLEHRALVEGGRRVSVVFEELGRPGPGPAIGEVHAPVEGRVTPPEAVGDDVPGRFGDRQGHQDLAVPHGPLGEGEAEGMKLAGRLLDVVLDLRQGEGVIGALVPVGLIFKRVEVEARPRRVLAPVRPLGDRDPAHQPPLQPPAWPPEWLPEKATARPVPPNPPRETMRGVVWVVRATRDETWVAEPPRARKTRPPELVQ